MYEKIFKNNVGYNTARIFIETNTKEFSLCYHLFDNPIQHIWQDIHLDNEEIITGTSAAIPFNTLLEELNNLCVKEKCSTFDNNITQDDLNRLHHEYVNSNHNTNWLRINSLIHAIESKLNDPFYHYDSTVNFYAKKEKFIPIRPEYKIFLNPDVAWGRLNLGYATLGKDWFDVLRSEDDDLSDLAIQENITSETIMMFSAEQPFPDYQQQKFYNWSLSSSIDVPTNLDKLSLGRYALGQLIIDDFILSFHNVPSDWYVPNHKCKLSWNKEMLDSTVKIKKITFFNSDMYMQSLLTHTGIKDYV